MSRDDDPLLRSLGELPEPPADDVRAARLGRAARGAFVAGHATAGSPMARAAQTGMRVATPVVLASLVGLYLMWALSAATALVR